MAKLFESDNKYSLVLLFITMVFLLLVGLAILFSNVKFEEKVDGTIATIINEGDLIINYVDGDEVELNGNKEQTYSITITNISTNKIYYSVFFESANMDVSVKIKDYDGNEINEISEEITSDKLINLNNIEGEQTLRYKITVENKSKNKFKGRLKVTNDSLANDTFSDLILLNNNVSVPETKVGEYIATNDEGLISTNDNKGTSYYFRGNVKNNYVKIGDNLFRIVRINGDSSVRLVLNDVLENEYQYNTNEVLEGQESYYLTLLEGASILNVLNTWFEDTLKEYDSFITNGDYCTDDSFINEINGIKYSSTYNRVRSLKEPDLRCNGKIYTGKVGLLSADEVLMAGGIANSGNSEYYLYNENIPGSYMTNSSYSINIDTAASIFVVNKDGAISDGILVSAKAYIRPVININVDAKVKGSGTIKDPYVIVS